MLNIKKYREKLGISQAELGRRIGVSRQTLNNYELGKREADYETLLKLSEELNATVQELLTDEGDKSDKAFITGKIGKTSIANASALAFPDKISAVRHLFQPDILNYYNKLNDKGQREAVKRVKELTQLPEYKK